VEARRDLLVGLFVLVALGIIVGTLIVTSGLGERRYALYMRTGNAQDLNRDTRVLLQGLEIGRVDQLNPVRTSGTGVLSFVGRLSIAERFPDGSPVALPRGSKAIIAQTSSNPISAPVIQIETPGEARRLPVYLVAGDTIESERRNSTMDQLGVVAQHLSGEVEAALNETRKLLIGTNRTVARTDSIVATAAPLMKQALTGLATSLERTDRMLATMEPKLPELTDSITATLSQTRQLLARLDQLADNANVVATENRASIRETLDHLHRSSIMMDHFIDQVSRRPVRMLTGVKAMSGKTDSLKAVSVKPDSDGVRP
jgi:ABC-type transporter Mla subunit MlaD